MDDTLRLIVAILGDVNHGKTTLVDYIAKKQDVSNEPGNITQDIRMRYVEDPKLIVLDTPGHHVFDRIRETAIDYSDLVVLVTAADRGPQSQAEKIVRDCNYKNKELLLVITKVDQATDQQKIKCYEDLEKLGCVSENIEGGDVATVEVSVKSSPVIGINKLKEYLNIFRSNKMIKPNKNKLSSGVILDVLVGKRGGFDALVKIQSGSFKLGSYFCAGNTMGKIRCMWGAVNCPIEEAYADSIIVINGFQQRPEMGAAVQIANSRREALKLFKKNKREIMTKKPEHKSTAEDGDNRKNLVLKAHSELNLDVLRQLLAKHNIRSCSMGEINPSEMSILKREKNSALVCFGKLGTSCKNFLRKSGIPYYEDQVIYQLMGKMQDKKEVITKVKAGRAKILKVFDFNGKKIAGCMVESGTIKLGAMAELVRSEGSTIFTGKITSLKHEKKKITEAVKGSTCGIVLSERSMLNKDYLEKDHIITYEENREITWVPFYTDPISKNKEFKK
jgi:translation initiation factor IF-2